MSYLINFDRFKKIIETIQNFDKKRERIDEFFEKEIMDTSFCMVTLGSEVSSTLINMLADEFDCWYSYRGNPTHWRKNEKTYHSTNDIEWWLYEKDDSAEVTIGNKKYQVDTIGKFYDYLVENLYDKKCKGIETEFEDEAEYHSSSEEAFETLKSLYLG